jgi:hypothetical protein
VFLFTEALLSLQVVAKSTTEENKLTIEENISTICCSNGVEGYAFVVFLICITMWGLFKYRTEIFEVASAGMVHVQQVVEKTSLCRTKARCFISKT